MDGRPDASAVASVIAVGSGDTGRDRLRSSTGRTGAAVPVWLRPRRVRRARSSCAGRQSSGCSWRSIEAHPSSTITCRYNSPGQARQCPKGQAPYQPVRLRAYMLARTTSATNWLVAQPAPAATGAGLCRDRWWWCWRQAADRGLAVRRTSSSRRSAPRAIGTTLRLVLASQSADGRRGHGSGRRSGPAQRRRARHRGPARGRHAGSGAAGHGLLHRHGRRHGRCRGLADPARGHADGPAHNAVQRRARTAPTTPSSTPSIAASAGIRSGSRPSCIPSSSRLRATGCPIGSSPAIPAHGVEADDPACSSTSTPRPTSPACAPGRRPPRSRPRPPADRSAAAPVRLQRTSACRRAGDQALDARSRMPCAARPGRAVSSR